MMRFYENKFMMASNRNDMLIALALQNQLIADFMLKRSRANVVFGLDDCGRVVSGRDVTLI